MDVLTEIQEELEVSQKEQEMGSVGRVVSLPMESPQEEGWVVVSSE